MAKLILLLRSCFLFGIIVLITVKFSVSLIATLPAQAYLLNSSPQEVSQIRLGIPLGAQTLQVSQSSNQPATRRRPPSARVPGSSPSSSTSSNNGGFWSFIRSLGRRGSCSNLELPLIALLPPSTTSNQQYKELVNGIALTTAPHPTFWFYIPTQLKSIPLAELMLQTGGEQDIPGYPISIHLATSGIVKLELPSIQNELDLETPYHWYFSVICNVDRSSRNPSVDGWIKRVLPENVGLNTAQIESATIEEKIDFYIQSELWLEAITLLAAEQCRNTQRQVSEDDYWNILLSATIGKENLAKISPISHCSSSQALQFAEQPSRN